MKNIHLIPTDKSSGLCINGKNGQNICITSNEEIKDGNYYITPNNTILKALGSMVINVEGVEMMVSYDEKDWDKSKIVAKIGYFYIDSQGIVWRYTKPIEVKKVTMQEVEKLFGCKVEIVKED